MSKANSGKWAVVFSNGAHYSIDSTFPNKWEAVARLREVQPRVGWILRNLLQLKDWQVVELS